MNITLQTINFKEDEELKNFALEKVGKIFQQHPITIRVDVTLKLGALSNPNNKW